ncbi:SET domain-containing protein [Rhizopogon vinicolor AM-OR11-026]|uniref:SET domain-containing protein n=1 Tax=Rhizopogon vinicolor AM-OR11-026 TaxID=1314800 RepID=A0A1B7NEZ0_9AGAM|nr:SET domain-containing protein [Rhizopogon vinicolor AM-OR11-026]
MESIDEPTTIDNRVESVFAEVLAEFRDWKVKYSEHLLRSLSIGKRVPPVPTLSDSGNIDGDSDTDKEQKLVQHVTVTSYSEDGTPTSTSTISLQVIRAEVLEPHEPYESCAPISRNVFRGDDDDRMAFIPFADDATFDHVDHTLCYDSLAWQEDYDPDLEVISLEAAYRLHMVHRLPYDDIDSTGVLPFKLFSSPRKPGLFTLSRRRDLLIWKGTTIPRSYEFPSSFPSPNNLRHRLEHINALFCPNLNCIESLCTVHVELNPMPPPRKPTMGLSELLNRVEHPCEAGCFLQIGAVDLPPQWSEDDISSLKTILEIEPDMVPCDHAELCLKPCHEVLYYRKLLYDPNEPQVEYPNEEIKGKPRSLEFRDNDPLEFMPNEPCYHSGTCDASSNCSCFKNKAHCERNCRCPANCARRWKGCRCVKGRNGMSCDKRCPCTKARRECDSELCVKCKCRETSICANSQIKQGHFKELEVKKSKWGLGAFLLEPAKQGDLIMEYVGELIYEETFDSRGEVAGHRGRSYVFGLNEALSLDSSYMGNPSRFVDHVGTSSASGEAQWNCRALVRLVNGEHRIGIFAVKNMEAGTEVLIDYGPAFFTR